MQRIAQEGFSQDHAVTVTPVHELPEHAFQALPVSYAAGNRRFASKIAARRLKRAEVDSGKLATLRESGKPAKGIPLTNSLSIADMPRLCNCVAAVMENTGSWNANPNFGGKECERLLNSAIGEGAYEPEAVEAAKISMAAPRPPHMPVVGLEQTPARWLANAGVDLEKSGTRLLLEELRARHPNLSGARRQAKIGGPRIRCVAS